MGIRRTALMAAALMAAVATPALGATQAGAAVPVVVLHGKGFGHGVGMAQDGAYWMGRAGSSDRQILNQFYPGTSLGHATGDVRVVVGGGSGSVLSFPQGGQVTGGATPLGIPPGGQVVLSDNGGQYLAQASYTTSPAGGADTSPTLEPAVGQLGADGTLSLADASCLLGLLCPPTLSTSTTTTLPKTTTTPPPNPGTTAPGPGTTTGTTKPPPKSRTSSSSTTTTKPPPPNATRSGGPLTATAAGAGTIRVGGRSFQGSLQLVGGSLVNQLNVELYLRGMGEVLDPSWPAASLEAQAIAERTYAMRAMQSAGQICDTTACQVYLGEQVAYPAMDQAIAATSGQVVTYGGGLATTVFSANGGGYEATPEEGFGSPNPGDPYLRAAPYLTHGTDPWTVRVGLGDLGHRFGYHGTLTGVAVTKKGPSGRALVVSLVGSGGTQTVSGLAFASALNLMSTLFTTQLASATTAPPLPPPGPPPQGLPGAPSALGPLAGLGLPPPNLANNLIRASPHSALALPGVPGKGRPITPLAAVTALVVLSGAAALALTKLGPTTALRRPLLASARGARDLAGRVGSVLGGEIAGLRRGRGTKGRSEPGLEA